MTFRREPSLVVLVLYDSRLLLSSYVTFLEVTFTQKAQDFQAFGAWEGAGLKSNQDVIRVTPFASAPSPSPPLQICKSRN